MKISVVIPAYNEESFLPHLLTSLRQQTFKHPYEVIVVDNNSTDKTAQIAKEYGAKVVSEKKKGYAHACNAGFAAAKGDIIARADADYVQPKDWLENIWKAFQKDADLIAVGGPLYPLESHWWENIIYYPAIVIWMYILKGLGRGFLFPNMAVRREIYEKTGGFDTKLKFGEDTEMCLALTRLGKVAYMPHIYVYTSIRKMRSLGFVQSVFGYSFGNQIAMYLGKEATIGLEVVRTVPQTKPQIYKPWIFLYAVPLSVFTLILLLVSYFVPTPTTKEMMQNTQHMAQVSDTVIQKRIKLIRNFTLNSLLLSIQPLKEI
jgi:glycosyltransferase involved in cell wall biosynthesis